MPDNVKDNPVEKREALLADRLRLHKGYRQRFVKGRNRHGRIHAFHQSLLVCQPAIFVDSKRDGTGAAHGRKGFRMKRAELDRRIANGETLDDIVPALMDDGADITSYDDLKRFAIEKIESDELYLAEHVLKACLDVADYYGYDYSMGTLEKPTAIDGVEDLIDYVED